MGRWRPETGLVIDGLERGDQGVRELTNVMMNKSLVVTTILNPPYTMIKVRPWDDGKMI